MYSPEQLGMLAAHKRKPTFRLVVKALIGYAVTLAIIVVLLYGTFKQSLEPQYVNLLKFFIILRIITGWFFAFMSILGVIITIVCNVEAEKKKTVKTHEFFLSVQSAGLNLPGTDIFMEVSDLGHLLLMVTLGGCGWFWSAFLYLPSWLICRFCYSGVRHYTVEYFQSLTPSEIAALENKQDPKPDPLQDIISKANAG